MKDLVEISQKHLQRDTP